MNKSPAKHSTKGVNFRYRMHGVKRQLPPDARPAFLHDLRFCFPLDIDIQHGLEERITDDSIDGREGKQGCRESIRLAG